MGTAIDIHTATVYFRGNNPTGFSKSKSDYVWFNVYVSSNTCTIAGNIMSLVNGSDFATNCSTIPNKYCFYRLFSSGAKASYNYLNASALSLPADYLTTGCYMEMFFYTNIKNLPKLPAQNLADSCYYSMFYRCLNIETMTTDGVNYVLPAEELAPHCYEYMFGFYNESLSTTFRCEIMATSCQDRFGNDIERCLGNIFNFQVNNTKSWNVYLYIYFKTLGTTSSTTCPTYDWFWGTKNTGRNYIYHDSGINSTSKRNSSNNSPYGAFPYGSTLYSTTYTYLTFNCAANGGTWEEGSSYNTDLRRVVKANYTAKTIPAPPVKDGARFLGWFTTASGDGEMLTEEQLKQITTATTVYARFVDNNKYTLFVNPSDKATITVTDNSSTSYTPGTLYILDSNDKTFTLSCTGVTSGYSFYRWIGGQVDGNTVMFREGQKDLVITGVITPASGFDNASGTVYLSGSGAGTSNKVPLPSEAVDLGAAGIWAKYNVDKTTDNGFAASDNATGSYFAWGMTDLGTGYAGASSMTDGETLPVSNETDAAYKYCGSKWRIATKDEWQTLLDNTTTTGPTNQNYSQTFTSNSNGNSIKLKNNGYYSSTGVGPYFETVIMYWTSTFESVQGSGTRAYAYSGSYCNSVTYTPIINAVQAPSTCTSHNYIQYGYAIRPILNVNKRTLTIHALHLDEDDNPVTRDYIYECDLNQNITVTATADEQGFIFDHWEDSDGNLYSEDNPLTFRVYDNLEFTAVFEFGTLIEHHVTFYDEDGITVLYEDDFREGKKPVYRGSTPTKAGGYVFNGWSPAITKLGESDATYTATYLKTYTITTSAAHGTVELTPASPTDQVSEGVYKTGTSLTMTVTADPGYVFTQWSDGNTQNPRTVSVTADASYTAEFRIESLPVSVDAYQSAPADVKQILYLLAPQTGNDSKIYRPVDMGNGLAWANKNVGANDSIDNGSFFYWGGTTAVTTAATSAYYTGLTSMSTTASYDATQYPLPAAADAATVNMGERWRMPTLEEIYYLAEETGCTESGAAASGFFYTNNDDGKKIFIPSAGCYKSTTRTTGVTLFWGSTVSYKSTYQSRPAYYLSGVSNAGTTSYYAYYALPVRAVYVPAYTPVTLTINAGERQYIYYCQPGQQVTVTAHPNTAASYLFDEWEDNHSTNPERTFTVTDNATYTAKMKDNPEAASYSVTFQDYDGTVLQSPYNLKEGRNPIYSGANPNRKGYLFKGWTDANEVFTASDATLPALTGDVVYTATYVKNPCLTITNTHASTATSVSMEKNNSSATNRTFYIKILDASGNVTTDWTQKIVNSTTAISFGSIPAGGSMLIRGSNTAISTTNTYYLYFVISGGSPEVSGNILSLVACTDGETVGSHTVTTYDFSRLFLNCAALTSAEDLELPSTTLATYCYYYMFSGCTGLKKAPKELPATALPQYCYCYMFNGCSSLTTAPDIKATSITGTYACANMFQNCTSLVTGPEELAATTLQSYCYQYMFSGCTSLTTAPALPATTLATYCYRYMFNGCTSLTTGPGTLPALALPQYCYAQMFYGCTSLTTAPEIEATSASSTYACQQMFYGCTSLIKAPSKLKITGTAQQYVYNGMFQNCSSLETAPDILATSQANYGWQNMFSGCSKLKKIRTYATTLAGTSNYKTSSWVASVPQTGDFYCPPTLARSYDANHIPLSTTYKWKVYSYNVTFVPVEGCTWNDASVSNKQFTWETDVDNVTDFIGNESLAGAIFYTDAACTTEISVADITAALATQKESSAATTKNYYVKKAPSTHTLTWNVSGGNELEGDYTHGDVDSGTGIIVPANPTRAGFEFAGWDAGNDGIADEVATIMPAFDLTYTAIWRQIFTVTFKDAEGNTLQSEGVTEGNVPVFNGDIPVKASADPDHVYNFTGWTDGNANFTANGTPLPAVTGNTVYTATYAYEMNYLTFTNTHASQTLTVQLKRGSNPPTNVTLNYRVISANGTAGAWQTLTTVNNTTTYTVGEIPAGARMQLYGSNPSGFGQSTLNYWKFYFGTTGSAVLSGDLMSIFSGTVSSFDRSQTLPSYAFYGLFYENSANNPTIISAKDLKLSATNLGQYCYRNMFYGCSNMTDAPQLSATTLAAYCYQNMFSYCTSLTAAPVLPATTLADYCYYAMFSYCTSLATAPQLPVTTLTEGCYQSMFQGCTALVNVQNLPGTNLPKNCYSEMFSGCTALTTAPEIMAAEDAVPGIAACNSMFNGCTALTKAPSVLRPRTLNANQVYYNMFLNCTSLQRGPDVWATSISSGKTALYGLYQNASNVRHIRVHFTAWGAMSFCSQWVYGVSSTGEFYCPPELPRTYSSTSYWNQAPRSTQDPWTIYSYDVTFVPIGGKWADNTNTSRQFTWSTSDKSDIDDFIAAQVDGENNSIIQGWFLDAACTEATTEEAVKADLSEQQTTVTKYVYVRLSGGSATLTWNFNGGSTTSTESQYTFGTMNEGDQITAPANPTLAGFEFVGWDAGDDGIADEVATNMPSSDLTYTAIWRQIYTITYENLNGATNTNPTSYTVATATITLENPGTRTGYTFTGWTMGGAPVTQIVTGSTGDKTITANWSANTNTAYTVKHYQQNLALDGYTEVVGDMQNLTGTTAGTTAAEAKSYTGFTAQSFEQGTIAADGSTVVSIYYNRDKYTVTVAKNENAYGTLSEESENIVTVTNVPYGTVITTGSGDNANKVTINGTPVTATPAASDAQYTYTFTGWTNGTETVNDDLTLTANFSRTVNTYTITWMNEDGTGDALETDASQEYGTATAFNGVTPTKSATAQYTYTFDGWATEADGDLAYANGSTPAVSGNATYYAHFSAATNTYTITWMNEDGTGDALETDASQEYGTATAFNGVTPTKSATAQYTYTFDGWATEADGDLAYANGSTPAVSGNATYYAHFSAATNTYTVTWENEDGTTLETDEDVEYGTMPEYNGATPTKEADTEHTYTFSGWTPALTSVTGEVTYTATYSTGTNSYTIRFLNWNNDVLQSGSVAYGTTPEYTGDAPTKASDLIYSYTFSGWDKAITPVDGNKDYKAVYTPTDLADFDLVDDKNKKDDYYDKVLSALVGKTRNVTYKRTMSPGQWNVVSLPFDFSLITNQGHPFNGNIYEMTGATYNDGYLDFNFMPMTTVMKANKPYIFYFYGNENKSDVRFENVKIKPLAEYDDSEDNVKVTVNVTGGTIKFRNTTYRENIYYSVEKERKRRVFINGTNLRYPNNPNIWIRAFRGYFYLGIGDEYITYIQPRLHIINGGQVTTLLVGAEQDNGTEVKKYIERGILVIERNGVKYNAQGARME